LTDEKLLLRFSGMDGRTFVNNSYKGAMALRNFVDQKSKSPEFDWYQRTYANTVLRKFLERQGLSDIWESRRWTTGRGLGRQTSWDQVSRRWVTLDQDTLSRINRLLNGKLHDEELPNLSKKIGDIIGQIDVKSPQRNALIALLNYINAQGSIALGYTEDILTPKTPSGDAIPGIGWLLWSVPSVGSSTWGINFRERVQYVSSQGGDITFILPEGKYGHTFTALGVCTSYRIWKEILRQINATNPSPDYKFMLSRVIEDDILSKIDDCEDLKNLYAYHIFRQAYGAINKLSSPIANTPIDKPTIGVHINRAIKALATGNRCDFDQRGATSYFELVYLLWAGIKFKMVGSKEKIQSLVDFSTGQQDPDRQEFHNRIKKLTTPST
jgi:hypothetical protein